MCVCVCVCVQCNLFMHDENIYCVGWFGMVTRGLLRHYTMSQLETSFLCIQSISESSRIFMNDSKFKTHSC